MPGRRRRGIRHTGLTPPGRILRANQRDSGDRQDSGNEYGALCTCHGHPRTSQKRSRRLAFTPKARFSQVGKLRGQFLTNTLEPNIPEVAANTVVKVACHGLAAARRQSFACDVYAKISSSSTEKKTRCVASAGSFLRLAAPQRFHLGNHSSSFLNTLRYPVFTSTSKMTPPSSSSTIAIATTHTIRISGTPLTRRMSGLLSTMWRIASWPLSFAFPVASSREIDCRFDRPYPLPSPRNNMFPPPTPWSQRSAVNPHASTSRSRPRFI